MLYTKTWDKALDSYEYPVDLTRFADTQEYQDWFKLNLDRGDLLQTMDFETRFRGLARDHLEAWAEVVFWKLYSRSMEAAVERASKLLRSGVSPAHLWSSCANYMANPNIESFRAFRSKLFRTPVVATAATFPAFICPEKFPMVDTQITRWARENSHLHRYSGIGGPDLERVPALQPGAVLKESHWQFVESWIVWCRFTARKLSQVNRRAWRARDVEMAVFTAHRSNGHLKLEQLMMVVP